MNVIAMFTIRKKNKEIESADEDEKVHLIFQFLLFL